MQLSERFHTETGVSRSACTWCKTLVHNIRYILSVLSGDQADTVTKQIYLLAAEL